MCQTKKGNSGGRNFTSQVTAKIKNQSTEFVWQRFSNKGFLLITQYGKIPNMYSVKFDQKPTERQLPTEIVTAEDSSSLHLSIPVTIACLLGPDKDEARSAIQYLINRTELQLSPHDLIIGIGLKECNGSILAEVSKVVKSMLYC